MKVACVSVAVLCGCSAALAATREYFIAANEIVWDYAPSGMNNFSGSRIKDDEGAATFLWDSTTLIGSRYKKAMYEEYTDETFTVKKTKDKWLGNLGPIIRAEVGDTLKIHFQNNAAYPYSMHPHGVLYDHASEGVNYKFAVGKGGGVPPGEQFVYTWEVPERSGPAAGDGAAVMWAYHSHHDEVKDIYSGLEGPLIVYRQGTLDPETGLALDVDKEFVLIFQVTDENNSHYLEDNCEGDDNGCDPEADPELFEESNLMHGINGRMYSNLPGLEMNVGDNVRWFIGAFGTEVDLHSAHFHATTLLYDEHRVDVIDLLPASFRTAEMVADNPGTWTIHCHVGDHIAAGMIAFYTVNPADETQATAEPVAEPQAADP